MLDELGRHAHAGVPYLDQRTAGRLLKCDPHPAVLRCGIQCILHNMADHPLQPLLVAAGGHAVDQAHRHLAAALPGRRLDALHNPLQVHARGSAGRAFAFAQLRHHLPHLVERAFHRGQHVGLKLRVVAVTFGVLQHQRQLGDDVFQVMHHEGRHAVEGVELAGFQQGLGGVHLGEKASRLARGGLEQVTHFPVQLEAGTRVAEDDEADQLLTDDQRHRHPGQGRAGQPGRQHRCSGGIVVPGAAGVELENPFARHHQLAEG